MKKYFNIAGPCNPDEHYMILSESRCRGITNLIEQKQYFVIHAARQSGKTTLLLDLTRKLNDEGRYHALYCSLESAQGITLRISPKMKSVSCMPSTPKRPVRYFLPK
ncbi:MAG: hypothetical protein BWK80_21630 [Desulfobacteraceae bacterium IS3]|nr:MAG: hypothetical protein BWK80_21630 [Desulfobacteraceae bacterium IS3]HAO19273.1 hypothetical protein [Desulfobacteraceae bacterium]